MRQNRGRRLKVDDGADREPQRRGGPPEPRRVGRGGDAGGGKQDGRPVRLHPVADRVLQEHRHAGNGERGQQRGRRSLPPAPRRRPDAGGAQQRHQRRAQAELAGQQLADVAQRVAGAPVARASALLGEARPAMAGVPPQHGREAQPGQSAPGPGPGCPQPTPAVGVADAATAPCQGRAGRRCICCPAPRRRTRRRPATSRAAPSRAAAPAPTAPPSRRTAAAYRASWSPHPPPSAASRSAAPRPRSQPAAGKQILRRARQQHRAEGRGQGPEQADAERALPGQRRPERIHSATIGGWSR